MTSIIDLEWQTIFLLTQLILFYFILYKGNCYKYGVSVDFLKIYIYLFIYLHIYKNIYVDLALEWQFSQAKKAYFSLSSFSLRMRAV